MADPVSILALMGLVYTGKKLSEQPVNNQPIVTGTPVSLVQNNPSTDYSRPENEANLNTDFMINSEERDLSSGEQMPVFADIAKQEKSSGGEVLDMKDRFVSDLQVHNNLSPVPQQKVGPGLGVDASVPAVGGFQQMFRALPENVGAYRLTTLPGRAGHGHDVSGGRGQLKSEIGHNKPERTAFLPERRPPVFGRGQGQGGSLNGVAVRQEYEKTKRSTNRSQTGTRTDGLEFASAKRMVPHGTVAQGPTRNKSDVADGQYKYMDNIQPGIASFYGAYENSTLVEAAGNKVRTPAELAQYGLRLSERRANSEYRKPNSGRMNVRGNPLQAYGMVTAVRADNTRMDGRTGGVSGGWTQNYVKPRYQELNPYKGNKNHRLDLGIAQRQLADNPLAHTLYK
jgi:hypothetical protein